MPLRFRDDWAGHHKPELAVGGGFRHRKILPRLAFDLKCFERQPFRSQEPPQSLGHGSAGKIEGQAITAHAMNDAGNVDSTAARVAACRGTAHLVRIRHALDRCGDIDRRVDGERDNVRHCKPPWATMGGTIRRRIHNRFVLARSKRSTFDAAQDHRHP